MKKTWMRTALMGAVIYGVSAHAYNFDGAYTGLDFGWVWTTAKLQGPCCTTKKNLNQNGFATFAKVGYGKTSGQVYTGGEVKGGYVFSSKRNNPSKLTRTWNVGIAGRVGGTFYDSQALGYFRLGLDYDWYIYKIVPGTKDLNVISVVPGIGVDVNLASDMFVTGAIDYALPISVSKPANAKVDTKPTAVIFRIGVGYRF